jgi:hypothetical protein
MENIKTLLFGIESKLWTNNPDYYKETLTDDVILLFTEIGRIDLLSAINAIKCEVEENRVWEDVKFEDEHLKQLTDDTILLTYRAKAKWNYEPSHLHLICSSIYQKKSNDWKLVFHQQTELSQTLN